jgi:serine phosphatase RsbU (regulator of sigma subunit)
MILDLPISTSEKENLESLAAARFVQQGLLPKERHFKRLFEDSFAFYAPQNIISGDFYWLGEKHGLKYLVVGDCSGHGISAALLSVLALNLFEYVIMNKGLKKTNKILQEIDKKFIESFKDSANINFDNPWIDLTVICINTKKNEVQYSSANRKVLHIQENSANLYKGSKYPIGGWQVQEDRNFQSYSFKYQKGDCIYRGSDGFQDQIGGPKLKKYSSRKLHTFLQSVHQYPFYNQLESLALEFANWRGKEDQLDDVCVVGLRL